MLSLNDVLAGVLLPALVAGLVLLACRRSRSGWPGALAVGGGCLAGIVGLRGWRGLPPRDATDWIFVIAAAATVLAASLCARGELRPRGYLTRGLLFWALGATAAWCLLARLSRGAPAETELAQQALMMGALLALSWNLLQHAEWPARTGWQRAEWPCVLLLVAVGSAVTLGVSGSQLLAQHAGAVAAALGGTAAASLLGWAPARADGALAVVSLVVGSLLIAGNLFADLSRQCAVLVGASPVAYMLVRGLLAGASPRRRVGWVMAVLAQVLVIGWAVAVALAASPSFEGL